MIAKGKINAATTEDDEGDDTFKVPPAAPIADSDYTGPAPMDVDQVPPPLLIQPVDIARRQATAKDVVTGYSQNIPMSN